MSDPAPKQATVTLDTLLRALCAVGLGASALLMWEYAQPEPTMCRAGCDVVRQSSWASIGGIPTPVFGIAFFALALELALLSGERARKLLLPLGIAGGLGGLGFILLQAFSLEAFCQYCMIVDTAALGIAALAVVLRHRPSPPLDGRGWAVAGAVIVASLLAPVAYGLAHRAEPPTVHNDERPAVPAFVRDEQARTPGVVTIVLFMDFECPHCRNEHFALSRLLEGYPKPVRIVRKHVPLPSHKLAPGAARAAICAEESGRGALMIDLLFMGDDLRQPTIESHAQQLGLELTAFQGCLASSSTTRRLEDDRRDAIAARVEGLPTFYVGEQRFEGQQRDEVVMDALERASRALAAAPR